MKADARDRGDLRLCGVSKSKVGESFVHQISIVYAAREGKL
ncbi:hypothetical protein AT5A_24445 [Agrobacterium tumefaciens 5A]|nr:hypothetical protein AT5A_24445 [Agrobacterium tumefaciens 5A]